MKPAAKNQTPELPEFAEAMNAFAAAAQPRADLEARVLQRLRAEKNKTHRPLASPVRVWSLAAAAALLLCAFLGDRVIEQRANVRLAQPAQVPITSFPQARSTAPVGAAIAPGATRPQAKTIEAADAKRAPANPVPVGPRLGRAGRSLRERPNRLLARAGAVGEVPSQSPAPNKP